MTSTRRHEHGQGTGELRDDLGVAFRSAITLGSSLLVTWSVAFVVKFQLPRHLGPERFGAFNFCESFAGAFFTLLDLGVDTYIVKEISIRPKHASDFFGGILLLRGALGAGMLVVMAAILGATHRPAELQGAVVVFGLTQLGMSINTSLGTLLQASTKVKRLALANVAAKLLWGAGLALGLFWHVSLTLLAIPILVAELMKAAVLVPAVHRTLGLRYRVDLAALKPVLIASFPFFMHSLAIGLAGKANVAVLEFIATDKRELGWFSATQNLSALAMLLSPLLSWVVVPLMSRARARSDQEVFSILRRAIEGLLVVVIPITLLIALGAEDWMRLAFGPGFIPGAKSLRILAPVLALTYLAMLLASTLVVLGRSWTLTRISISAAPIAPTLVLLLVPLCRRLLGTGGEAVGAALAVILSELFVVSAMLRSVGREALDGRNLPVVLKSAGAAIAVALLHQPLRPLGHARLGVDMLLYLALVLASGALRVADVRATGRMLLSRRGHGAPPETDGPPAAAPQQSLL